MIFEAVSNLQAQKFYKFPEILINMVIKNELKKYMRVMQIARKPGKEEFLISTKISALGIAVVGFIGFAIFLIFMLVGW